MTALASTRWPLHPQPFLDECLSSWLQRLAAAYDRSPDDLCRHAFGLEKFDAYALDFSPPDDLVTELSVRTGIPKVRIRAMTLQSYVPFVVDTLDSTALDFAHDYVTQFRVLLPKKLSPSYPRIRKSKKHKSTLIPWQPWENKEHLHACPECLTHDSQPYFRLHWRMAFVTTCPAHRLFLMDVGQGSLKTAQFLIKATEPDKTPLPDDLTLWLDTKTLEALQTGYVRIGEAPPTNAATYFRMVRTMIEEMNSRKFTNPAQSEAMKNLWRRNGLEPYGGTSVSTPFEYLDLLRRSQITKVVGYLLAGFPETLIDFHRSQHVHREWDPHLPGALQDAYLCVARPSEPYPSGVPKLEPRLPTPSTSPCWLRVHKAINDLISDIKADPTAAEPLVAFLKAYGRPPKEVDDLFEALRREVT